MSTTDINNDSVVFLEEKKDDYLDELFENIIEGQSFEESQQFNEKVVKFADDEAEKYDALRDKERSRQELLDRIATLTDTLNEAQAKIMVEREKRKKKEKSLMKLAKELKKRNALKERDEDRMEELLDKKKYLEHHWALAKQQLDEERALHAKRRSESKKEYEEILEEEKTKFERTKKENEARLEDLKSAHVEQYDQLSREALRTNRELDRLRRELVGKGIDPQLGLSKTRKGGRVWLVFVFVFGILSVAMHLYQEDIIESDILTRDGFCAPVVPGTIFDDNAYGSFNAPWWAPEAFKEQAFNTLCVAGASDTESIVATRIPPSIEWTRDGKNNKLTVSVEGSVVLKKSIAKTQISSNKIQFWKRNNVVEEVSFNWMLVDGVEPNKQ